MTYLKTRMCSVCKTFQHCRYNKNSFAWNCADCYQGQPWDLPLIKENKERKLDKIRKGIKKYEDDSRKIKELGESLGKIE